GERRTAFPDAIDRRHDRPGPGRYLPECHHFRAVHDVNLGYGVSWCDLLRFGITIELTNQTRTVFGGALGQIVDEAFDLIPAGLPEGGSSAVIGRIGLHKTSIELVLTNQQAEAVAEARLAVVVTIISVRRGLGLIRRSGRVGPGGPAEFLYRTEPDSIGLAEGAVDGTGFGDAHLGAVDQGRDVGGIGVPVADEPARARGFV